MKKLIDECNAFRLKSFRSDESMYESCLASPVFNDEYLNKI